MEEYKNLSPVFEEDVYDAISLETCVKERKTIGAPGLARLQVEKAKEFIKNL